MPAPLPASLRDRFKQYIDEGLSARAAALRLRISPATGVRWAQRIRRGGEASVSVMGRPVGHGKLAPYADFFQELIAQDPDITLFELRDALADAHGVKLHHSGASNNIKLQTTGSGVSVTGTASATALLKAVPRRQREFP